jgi:hypothetical protein
MNNASWKPTRQGGGSPIGLITQKLIRTGQYNDFVEDSNAFNVRSGEILRLSASCLSNHSVPSDENCDKISI